MLSCCRVFADVIHSNLRDDAVPPEYETENEACVDHSACYHEAMTSFTLQCSRYNTHVHLHANVHVYTHRQMCRQ